MAESFLHFCPSLCLRRSFSVKKLINIFLLYIVFNTISLPTSFAESAASHKQQRIGSVKSGGYKTEQPLPRIFTDSNNGDKKKPDEQNNAQIKKAFRKQDTQTRTELNATAYMTKGGAPIQRGLQWRVYSTNLGLDNKLPLIAQSQEGEAKFLLKPGDYILFAAFGRAEHSKRITLEADKPQTEIFQLNAGGLKPDAVLLNGKMNKKQLHFAIYGEEQINEQTPLIDSVKPGEIIRLPAGSYHIVCNYGAANATVRSDIRISAGKLLEATMQQKAAQIILKLVRQTGGEALADTSWAVMNDSGDIVREIANANAYIILAEGSYVAIARNKEKIYQKEFSVSSGKDGEIEVLATEQNTVDEDSVD